MTASIRIHIKLYLSICIKLNSKGINELKLKSDTKNFLEEDVGDIFELIDTGKNFLNSTPITLALKSTMGPEKLLYGRGNQHCSVEAPKLHKLLLWLLVNQYNLIVRPVAEDNISIYH